MKGVVLAAGNGTRLYPAAKCISKVLMPVYDRPMIYYPLSTLLSMNVRDVMIVVNEKSYDAFVETLGDGSQFGINIVYSIQYQQKGIADALLVSKDFIKGDDVVLILGDNIIYGNELDGTLLRSVSDHKNATVFGYRVSNPEQFGIAEFDDNNKVVSIEEKPLHPKSNCAIIGLYIYDEKATLLSGRLKPSERGELEITDLNKEYLLLNELNVTLFDDSVKWLDAGTFDSLLEASLFIKDEEKKVGRKVMCPETIAYEKGYITKDQLRSWLDNNPKSEYYQSIRKEIES